MNCNEGVLGFGLLTKHGVHEQNKVLDSWNDVFQMKTDGRTDTDFVIDLNRTFILRP